jgi:hypothetical protein
MNVSKLIIYLFIYLFIWQTCVEMAKVLRHYSSITRYNLSCFSLQTYGIAFLWWGYYYNTQCTSLFPKFGAFPRLSPPRRQPSKGPTLGMLQLEGIIPHNNTLEYTQMFKGDQPRNWPALDKLLFQKKVSIITWKLDFFFFPLKLTCLPLVKKKLQKLKKNKLKDFMKSIYVRHLFTKWEAKN